MLIFGGTQSTGLAWSVAKHLKAENGKSEVKIFPDGEKYVRLNSKIEGEECAVIQTVRSNDDFVELLLMLDALRDFRAHQVHAIVPYLAYMRQDKRFNDGEALSAKTILKLIDEVSDNIMLFNCHFLNCPMEAVFHHIRFQNLCSMHKVVDYLGSKVSNPIFIAPDKGSIGFAKEGAQQLGCEFDHLKKTRLSGEDVEIEMKNLDVKGHDVIILDDIISTGGTIVESAKVIKHGHPKSINVGCIHGLFLKGIEQFKGTVDRLVSTDTVENPVSKVSVADIIAERLR